MRVLSVNVAQPQVVRVGGRRVETAIFKRPAEGPVRVSSLNLVGDAQADLAVHGGVDKAVYVYSWKNVEFWRQKLGRDDLRPGTFGENLTVDEFLDGEVAIGDELEIGTARFQVTAPRIPCYKLGIALGRPDFPKIFHSSGRNGFYLRVLRQGVIAAGDPVLAAGSRESERVSIAEFVFLVRARGADQKTLERVLKLKALPDSWKSWLAEKVGLTA